MTSNRTTVLGINPGTRYIGFAVLRGSILIDWGVSVVGTGTSQERSRNGEFIVSRLITRYKPSILALKELHPSRRSSALQIAATAIADVAMRHGLQIRRYSIYDTERLVSPDKPINKRQMAELIRYRHPALRHALYREQDSLNPYHIRMFEAVGLAMAAQTMLDQQSHGEGY